MLVALVGAGFYLVRTYGPGLVEGVKQTTGEGEAFGRRTNNQGCLDEGIARHKTAEGFGELIKANLFLRSCLEASSPTPGFCEGVPHATEFIKSAQWQAEQCGRHNLSTEKQCQQVFAQVQQFCERRTEGAGVGGDDEPPAAPAPAR
jgi:hypothetical protein